jgi:hypothetical protein
MIRIREVLVKRGIALPLVKMNKPECDRVSEQISLAYRKYRTVAQRIELLVT